MPRGGRLRAVLVLAACGIGAGVGCVPLDVDPVKHRFVERILAERAAGIDRETRRRIGRSLLRAESEHEVDALLLLVVAEQESRLDPRARSPRGALGLMQIRPATARAVARRHGIPHRAEEDLYDPAVNVAIGAAYLSELREAFGSWEVALAAYRRGPGQVRRARALGRPVRSRYASRVLRRVESLRERYRRARSGHGEAPGGRIPGRALEEKPRSGMPGTGAARPPEIVGSSV